MESLWRLVCKMLGLGGKAKLEFVNFKYIIMLLLINKLVFRGEAPKKLQNNF